MELGHHPCGARALLLVVGMKVRRYAASVVDYADGVVGMYGDRNLVAKPGQRFVHRVVHYLEHHVMTAGAVAAVADIHPGTLAHRLEALEDLDAARIVIVAV